MRIVIVIASVAFIACHSPDRDAPTQAASSSSTSAATSVDVPATLTPLIASTSDLIGDAGVTTVRDASTKEMTPEQRARLLRELESQQMAMLAVLSSDAGLHNMLDNAGIQPVDLSDGARARGFDGGLHVGNGGPVIGHGGGLADLKTSMRDH